MLVWNQGATTLRAPKCSVSQLIIISVIACGIIVKSETSAPLIVALLGPHRGNSAGYVYFTVTARGATLSMNNTLSGITEPGDGITRSNGAHQTREEGIPASTIIPRILDTLQAGTKGSFTGKHESLPDGKTSHEEDSDRIFFEDWHHFTTPRPTSEEDDAGDTYRVYFLVEGRPPMKPLPIQDSRRRYRPPKRP